MSANNYRLDLKLPRETINKLEELRVEYKDEMGHPVSMNKLISNILAEYLDRLPLRKQ